MRTFQEFVEAIEARPEGGLYARPAVTKSTDDFNNLDDLDDLPSAAETGVKTPNPFPVPPGKRWRGVPKRKPEPWIAYDFDKKQKEARRKQLEDPNYKEPDHWKDPSHIFGPKQ